MRLILVLFIGSIVMTTWSEINIVERFEIDSSKGTFSHMVLDKKTGNIYIGAMNSLYQLSSDLKMRKTATTGPKDDNPNCPPRYYTASCDQHKEAMNAYNKALLIDYNNNNLIACSSLYHGICERYNLSDIESKNPDIEVPVVANDATSTTVALVAPGPPNGISQSDVLYVAASRTNAGQSVFRDWVHAIASRKLETFNLVYAGLRQSSSKSIQETLRDKFPVYYIYGFSSDKFSYFVTVQKQNPNTESYISKLIRVCQADKNYYSYAEVQLKCMHNGTLYNLVQAAYVAKAGSNLATDMNINEEEDVLYVVCSIGNPSTTIPGSDSALCVYPLRTVRKIFTENIKACFDGIGNTGPSHVISQSPCMKTSLYIKDDYCGTYDFNNPIEGLKPIQTEAAITFNTTVSAVAVTTEFQDTIAFVGTVKGHAIKVLINSKQMATSYEDITVEDGTKINADMIFDSDGRYLYVLTDRKVYKLKLQECKHYTTCLACLYDRYCGWCGSGCNLMNECITPASCGLSSLSIAIVKGRQYTIPIDQLPKLRLPNQQMHECVFKNRNDNIKTKANITSDGTRTCQTPLSSQLPPIQTGEDHIEMNLYVLVSGEKFKLSSVIFYDCSLHTSCTSCTTKDYGGCTWCIENNECTFDTSDCPDKTTVQRYSVHPMSPLCPRITSNETEILVPSETDIKIVVSALDLKEFQTPLICFFNLDNVKQVYANVTRLSNGESIIECELVHFSYVGDTNKMKVTFQISWASLNNNLDNPDNIQVIMYKCDKMADSCGECLTLNNKYKCGWCDQHCTIQSQCSSMWLSTAETCPKPEIIKIKPTSGPKAGGTYITITGINLGLRFEDISGVYIENSTRVQCTTMKVQYIAPRQIVCVSGASNITGTGKLVVTINNKYNATASHIIFSYVNPVLVTISPFRGPKSGGTLVTLSGNYMNTGTNITVFIGKHGCNVKSFNSTELTCVTSMAPDTTVEKLGVQFDKQMVTSEIIYEYTTDPTIINIDPKLAIVSGGIMIDVTGTQLDTIQEPKMVLWYFDTTMEGECKVANATLMHCYSPQVKFLSSNCSSNSAIKELYSYGFILDDVRDVLNLTKKDKDRFETFNIVCDPILQPLTRHLEKTYQYEPNSDLIINSIKATAAKGMAHMGLCFVEMSSFLTLNRTFQATYLSGVSARDVTVWIGKGSCSEIVVGESKVTCKPPKDQPKSQQESTSPEVIVNIGRNFSLLVGYLRYDQKVIPVPISPGVTPMIIGLTVGVVVLVIMFFVVFLVLKKREKNMEKNWQMQMENLESRLDGECKEDNTDTSGASGPVIDKSTLAVLKDARLIINRNRLRLGDIIGKGHYGCVLKGYLTLPSDRGDFIVAIKTLHKKNLRNIDVDAFLREIMIMKEFHHPNVLRLLGICLGQNEIPIMVLPFMEYGDLLSFIRTDTNTPTVTDLIHFGIGIAEGMAYLSDHKFVHRDLAARNCMLDEELNVKVADFGLSREIYEREYYTSDNKKTKLPIRWMAPESMEKGNYSSKSDVWSYGIVLWELVTRGVTPYYEVDNWDIVKYLQKGRRLHQPQYCPDKLYVIMKKCWLADPQDRPTFSVLAREITDMLSVAEQDMQQGLLKIDIRCAQFNQVDSAKYHYAHDDTYLEPPTKPEPLGGVNSGTDYMEVFDGTNDMQIYPIGGHHGTNKNEPYHYEYNDTYLEPLTKTEPIGGTNSGTDYMEAFYDTNDVQIYPMGGANGNNKNEPYHYAHDDTYLMPPTKTEPIGGVYSGNDYIEVLDDTNDVKIDPASGVNGKNKNEPYHYAHDDSSLEPRTTSEPVDSTTNNYMEEDAETNGVQIYPPCGPNSKNNHEPCHNERLSFDVDSPGKLPQNT